jgi:hypothetical protein
VVFGRALVDQDHTPVPLMRRLGRLPLQVRPACREIHRMMRDLIVVEKSVDLQVEWVDEKQVECVVDELLSDPRSDGPASPRHAGR